MNDTGYSIGQTRRRARADPMADATVPTGPAAVEALRLALEGLAEVRAPDAAQEPILAPPTRTALLAWLREMGSDKELAEVGLKPRTKALLYGPPGTGKSTFAHHLAQRLGLPLVVVGPENLTGMYMGETEKATAGIFDALKATRIPHVALLDEFDGLASKRTHAPSSSAGQARLAAFTVMLRKMEQHQGLLLAATNRADSLDAAMWRRFDMQIAIELPTGNERFEILARYFAPFDIGDDGLELLTEATSGASPALLRGLAEGLKRAIVLGPKLGALAPADFADAARRVVVALRPPPEIDDIPLWTSDAVVASLAEIPWPPPRGTDA